MGETGARRGDVGESAAHGRSMLRAYNWCFAKAFALTFAAAFIIDSSFL